MAENFITNMINTVKSLNGSGLVMYPEIEFQEVDEMDEQELSTWEGENITRRFEVDWDDSNFTAYAEQYAGVEFIYPMVLNIGYDANQSRVDLNYFIAHDMDKIVQKLSNDNVNQDETNIYERTFKSGRKINLDDGRIMLELNFEVHVRWDSINV